jgi:hypothetical protein
MYRSRLPLGLWCCQAGPGFPTSTGKLLLHNFNRKIQHRQITERAANLQRVLIYIVMDLLKALSY